MKISNIQIIQLTFLLMKKYFRILDIKLKYPYTIWRNN